MRSRYVNFAHSTEVFEDYFVYLLLPANDYRFPVCRRCVWARAAYTRVNPNSLEKSFAIFDVQVCMGTSIAFHVGGLVGLTSKGVHIFDFSHH